jgi:hypothetical protein
MRLFALIRVHSRPCLFLAAFIVTSCGYVGNPMPPTLDMPQRVTDLRVAEYGDRILIEFTVPPLTTEGLPLKSIRALDLRIGVPPAPWSDGAWEASAKQIDCPATGPGPLTCYANAADTATWIGKDVVIRARATGPKGKTSEWSNVKNLPVQPPLAPPADLKVENTPAGFTVTWKSPAEKFRIFRATGDGPPVPHGEPAEPSLEDPDVEFGSSYKYYVQAVAGDYQQSEMSVSQPLLRADNFTPTVPTGLIAEQSANGIQLSWDRNTDLRFQGYNVYRSVDGGAPEKVASLITAPVYTDRQITSGKRYEYRITAVGVNGRESERSAPAAVPAQ